MKPASAELQTHIQGEITTLATCVKITLTRYQPRIAAITQDNPGVVTTRWAHGFETGDRVRIVRVRGMAAVNRSEYEVTKISEFRFSIGVDTTGFSPYIAKGEARKIIGYTDFSRDLVFGGTTYKSTLGYTPQSVKQAADGSVDAVEVQGILQNAAKQELQGLLIDGITDEDLIAGRYDHAELEMFVVNYEDLNQGRVVLTAGNLGETTLRRGRYESELSGKAAHLQELINEVYTAQCRADLGDDFDGSDPADELQPGFGCKVRLDPPEWQAEKSYSVRSAGDAALGSVVKPTADLGRHFRCIQAGISGALEPAWDLTLGATTIDGLLGSEVQWQTIEALTKTGRVHKVIDRRRFLDFNRDEAPVFGSGAVTTLFPITAVNTGLKRFTIAGNHAGKFPINSKFTVVGSSANDGTYSVVSAANSGANTLIIVGQTMPSSSANGNIVGRVSSLQGFFTHGKVTFLTGKNRGISREVRNFSVATTDGVTFTGPGYFELFEALPFDLQQGDDYEVTAGCDKSLRTCIDKFDNVHNRRAEDNIPGMDSALLYPDAK